jgi:hypothetical protein
LAWTVEQYQKLCGAIARGVRRVRYSADNEVEYFSLDQMLAAKKAMEEALGLDTNGQPLASRTYDRTVGVYDPGY